MIKKITSASIFNLLRSSCSSIKLTELRKDVLKIIIEAKKPIAATEILNRLKKIRESAEPPTVYRVIEYLLEKEVIHKIASENKYILCSHLESSPISQHGLIFVCKICLVSCEVKQDKFIDNLRTIAKEYQFLIDNPLLEIQSLCKTCAKKQS